MLLHPPTTRTHALISSIVYHTYQVAEKAGLMPRNGCSGQGLPSCKHHLCASEAGRGEVDRSRVRVLAANNVDNKGTTQFRVMGHEFLEKKVAGSFPPSHLCTFPAINTLQGLARWLREQAWRPC